MLHAVEVAFESIHVSGPEATELSQPHVHLLERFGFQPVKTALCVHRGFDETGLSQHPQVLGHSRLRHAKLTFDLSHRSLARGQEAQDRAAVRLRNDFEDGFHVLNVRHEQYACQGIYAQGQRAAVQVSVDDPPRVVERVGEAVAAGVVRGRAGPEGAQSLARPCHGSVSFGLMRLLGAPASSQVVECR